MMTSAPTLRHIEHLQRFQGCDRSVRSIRALTRDSAFSMLFRSLSLALQEVVVVLDYGFQQYPPQIQCPCRDRGPLQAFCSILTRSSARKRPRLIPCISLVFSSACGIRMAV